MPVMPGYTHADTPHPATIQPAGYRYGRLILAAGRSSPELAYEALREQLWPGWGPALPPVRVRNRDATIA